MTQAVESPATLRAEIEHAAADRGAEPSFLADLRGRAADRFSELGFPTPRLEEWRFTNLKAVAATPWTLARRNGDPTPAVERWAIPNAHRLVLVDGRFTPELSKVDGLPSGVVLTGLADALERCPELVEPHLAHHASCDEHAITALNTALFADGVFLYLPAGAEVDRPIHLLSLSTPHGGPTVNLPRLLMVAGTTSQATVVEGFAGTGGGYLSCPVTEIVVGAGAVINHYRLQEEGSEASHVAVQQVRLGRDSQFESHSVSLGGALSRIDIGAVLDGEGSHATLNGLYLPDDRQHMDTHLTVRHAKPHCTSHELYKGILGGSSRAVFNGRIIVDQDAQKTDAKQSNRNLLLSKGALVNSNPQLEIFADDVRCTHGSTVGRLDEDAVFYLRSRGIDRATAESLLVWAFASDIVQRIRVDDVRRRLEEYLFARLPQGELVREAV